MLGKGGGGGGHLRRGRRREEQVCLQSHYDLPVTCCDFCIILRTHVHEQHPGCDNARLQPPIASRPLQGEIGRASCRARGCKDVSISWVAVSFTNICNIVQTVNGGKTV